MHTSRRLILALVWLGLLALLGLYVARSLRVSTDLRSFMPPPATPDQQLLMDQIGNGPGSRLLLLAIAGADADTAAALSRDLSDALKHDKQFTEVINGRFDLDSLDPKLLPYRYLLSPTLDTHRLDAAYLHDQLQQRLADLGSPAGAMLENLVATRSDAGNAETRPALDAGQRTGHTRWRLVRQARRGAAAGANARAGL